MTFNSNELATVHGRILGAHLREIMSEAGLNGKAMADRLGISESRVSRTLVGKYIPEPEQVAAMLAVCGVKGKRAAYVLRLVRDRDLMAWKRADQVMGWQSMMRQANKITEYAQSTIPDVLRTYKYAHAELSTTIDIDPDRVDDIAAESMVARRLFDGPKAPHYTVILSEGVLRGPVGTDAVMREQLSALLELSVRPGITIRVVPRSVGAHAGRRGSFCLTEAPDLVAVCTKDELNLHFVDHPDSVAVYTRIVDWLAVVALSPKKSSALIGEIAVDTYGAQVFQGERQRAPRTRKVSV